MTLALVATGFIRLAFALDPRKWRSNMAGTAQRTDPKLWETVKKKVTQEDKGGHAGEWSARKAQLAVAEYKKSGGGYAGKKDPANHLAQWTREDWGTKSGQDSLETGERYLPKQTRKQLTKAEYDRTSAKKRADLKHGKQFSQQPDDIAKKTAHSRAEESSVKVLRQRAAARQIVGRSKMNKQKLVEALT